MDRLSSGLQMSIEPFQRFTEIIGAARLVLSKKQKVRPVLTARCVTVMPPPTYLIMTSILPLARNLLSQNALLGLTAAFQLRRHTMAPAADDCKR